MEHCLVRNNFSSDVAGGISSTNWGGYFNECIIAGNTGSSQGGGGAMLQRALITNSIFRNNGFTEGQDYWGGGGLRVQYTTMINCLVTGNTGGGVKCSWSGQNYFYNVTIANNLDDDGSSNDQQAGLQVDDGAEAFVMNCIISVSYTHLTLPTILLV